MTPDRAHIAYSTTKLGILAFSKSTAIAYAKKGIRCNTVIPGLMHTALVEHRLAKTIAANDLQGLIDKRNAQCPTGKWDAWDIAHAVLFLASDEARDIHAPDPGRRWPHCGDRSGIGPSRSIDEKPQASLI